MLCVIGCVHISNNECELKEHAANRKDGGVATYYTKIVSVTWYKLYHPAHPLLVNFLLLAHNSSPWLLRETLMGACWENGEDTCGSAWKTLRNIQELSAMSWPPVFITVRGDLTVKVLPALSSGRTVSPLDVLNQEQNSVSTISGSSGI